MSPCPVQKHAAYRNKLATGLDAGQPENDHSRTPDVRAEMERVSLQRLALVFFGGAIQLARPGNIDSDRDRHYDERPDVDLYLGLVKEQSVARFPDNPGAGCKQQESLAQGREVFDLAVAVKMCAIGGPPGDYRAEDDVLLAAVTTQQQRPRGLRNRVQGQLIIPRKGLQPCRLPFGKPLLRRLRGAVAWRDRSRFRGSHQGFHGKSVRKSRQFSFVQCCGLCHWT